MSSCYLVGTWNEVPGTDDKTFIVLGTYAQKEQAKAGIESLSPALMQGQYKSGITLYELNHEKSKLHTFQKEDLKSAYENIQKQQKQQLEQQKQQLQQQQ